MALFCATLATRLSTRIWPVERSPTEIANEAIPATLPHVVQV